MTWRQKRTGRNQQPLVMLFQTHSCHGEALRATAQGFGMEKCQWTQSNYWWFQHPSGWDYCSPPNKRWIYVRTTDPVKMVKMVLQFYLKHWQCLGPWSSWGEVRRLCAHPMSFSKEGWKAKRQYGLGTTPHFDLLSAIFYVSSILSYESGCLRYPQV